MSNGALAVVRDANGRVMPGSPPINHKGNNHWNTPRLRTAARIDFAVDLLMEEVLPPEECEALGINPLEPACAQRVANRVIAALSNMDTPMDLKIVEMFVTRVGVLEQMVAANHEPEAEVDTASSQVDAITAEFETVD